MLPLFDSLENIDEQDAWPYLDAAYCIDDIRIAATFLKAYRGSQGTFNAYRREIERLIHWCALIEKKILKDITRDAIERFVIFCQKPPKNWVGLTKPPRFIIKEGQRVPNPAWRPFIVAVSKSARRKGEAPETHGYSLSQGSLKELFAILGSFYNYMLQEEYVPLNPIALIRQKSKFIRRNQGAPKIRRLSEMQWECVISTTRARADEKPQEYERMLFMMSAFYAMYLRISEFSASERWTPTMNHFARDSDGNWWFTTVGKGNKERQIAVSESMLAALKRWRTHLNLSPLPSPADTSPLLPKTRGQGPMQSINHIRRIVQQAFDQAIYQLQQDGFTEEADMLNEATVHWLRHTGISDDVKIRPREHVRDDAGHSSSAITDKYIDIELKARHQSARKKAI